MTKKAKKLFVAKPLLPNLQHMNGMLERIWQSGTLTNEGHFHKQLEGEIKSFLDVPVAKLFSSGTTALICAIQALKLSEGAEIITTPLTFAATAHAIAACGYRPVFADIDEASLTLDPRAVERAVTDRTEAVIGVHVYGTICDVAGLSRICRDRGLHLLFDAAHAFGAVKDGVPVGVMGDMSVFSLHATKLFHTAEGGVVTTPHEDMAERLRLVRNFGIVDEERVTEIGINGKMSEIHAAIGILNLPLVDVERQKRASLRQKYNDILAHLPGLRPQIDQPGLIRSEQYYPVVIDPELAGRTRDEIYDSLKERDIFSRKYFWPICTDFTPYKDHPIHSVHNVPVAERIKHNVLCLPFHSGVEDEHIDIISEVLSGAAEKPAADVLMKTG